jgi:hypothetical protein
MRRVLSDNSVLQKRKKTATIKIEESGHLMFALPGDRCLGWQKRARANEKKEKTIKIRRMFFDKEHGKEYKKWTKKEPNSNKKKRCIVATGVLETILIIVVVVIISYYAAQTAMYKQISQSL